MAVNYSFSLLVALSLILRLALVAYGEWQDKYFAVKFTDVDYNVFSDAAKLVAEGRSPYLRPTYRYTPILAIALVPNHYIFFSFGKLLFVLGDLTSGWLLYKILSLQQLPEKVKLAGCIAWLLNPLTAVVSSRGNVESLLSTLVLATIYCIMQKRLTIAAAFFGLAVHMKIFPAIYTLSFLLLLDENYSGKRPSSWWKNLLNGARVKFALISGAVFFAVSWLCYFQYGHEFIYNAYLYHVTRRDTRHNFSIYFYMLYLIQDSWHSSLLGLLTFVPQVLIVFFSSLYLHRDISLCCFVQTFAFVTYNKVCTSQYFLWYLSLLPLILVRTRMTLKELCTVVCLWFLGQGAWLAPAYLLEFEGYNTFLLIWFASIAFFSINLYILSHILYCHGYRPTFVVGEVAKAHVE